MAKKRYSFQSYDAYSHFAGCVRNRLRFIHPPEIDHFLESVLASAETRQRVFPPATIFWRAQEGGATSPRFKGDIGGISGPHPPERMKPLRGRAREGRVNPAGIAHLYMTDDPDTAIAEIRPWIGSWISLGKFQTLREIRIVDCTLDSDQPPFDLPRPKRRDWERWVWHDMNQAFSKPISANENSADYAPTQVLGDLFKNADYDGVVFQSSCAPGKNIVLFYPDLAALERCNLCVVESISHMYAVTGSVYTTGLNPLDRPSGDT